MNPIRRLFNAAIAPWRKSEVAAPAPAKRAAMNIKATSLALMLGKDEAPVQPFKLPELAPGVLPAGKQMACDSAITDVYAYAAIQSTFAEGVGFVGFPALASLSQRAEYRRPCEILAKEMTRKWIKLHSTGEEDKTQRITELEAEMKRLGVQDVFAKATEGDAFYGRMQVYMDTGDTDNPDELKTALIADPLKIGIGKLKALRVIEPIWTYPNRYNADDPLRADYFKPETWFVMGKEVHDTRLLTFISKQLPDLLKPAYAFAGLSLIQILIPYVNNWLRTRQSVSDLLHSYSTFVLKTDLSSLLNGGAGTAEQARFALFNTIRDNQGLMVLNKDTEDFANISVPLGSLDHLQAQALEQIASVCGIPLVILLGITPSGLNASSSADLDCFYSYVASQQQHLYTPLLSRLMEIIQLSLWGEIDRQIGFTYQPLQALDELQLSETRHSEIEAGCMLIDRGVISPEEERARLANQPESMYHGLDLSEVADPATSDLLGEPELTDIDAEQDNSVPPVDSHEKKV
jgi:hypothetical protein